MKEMTALQRIKEIEYAPSLRRYYDENLKGNPQLMLEDIYYLLKAFKVMQEIAHLYLRANSPMMYRDFSGNVIDKEFEERMEDEKEKT